MFVENDRAKMKDSVRMELHEVMSHQVQATATLHKNGVDMLNGSEGSFEGYTNEIIYSMCSHGGNSTCNRLMLSTRGIKRKRAKNARLYLD